jgi:hypothetical protein
MYRVRVGSELGLEMGMRIRVRVIYLIFTYIQQHAHETNP